MVNVGLRPSINYTWPSGGLLEKAIEFNFASQALYRFIGYFSFPARKREWSEKNTVLVINLALKFKYLSVV